MMGKIDEISKKYENPKERGNVYRMIGEADSFDDLLTEIAENKKMSSYEKVFLASFITFLLEHPLGVKL